MSFVDGFLNLFKVQDDEFDDDYDYDGIHVYRFTQYELPTNAWPGAGDYFNLHSFDKALKRIGIAYEDIAVVHAHVTGNAKYANYADSERS